MKRLSVLTTALMLFATSPTGCASEQTGADTDTVGSVEVNLIVGNTDVKAVSFDVVCDSGITLSGQLNVNDEQNPPVAATIMDLPPGDCSITLTAFDNAGDPLCTGSEDFTVLANDTVQVNVVLLCDSDAEELLGNADIDATFEFVEGNNCPRLHFLNAVPSTVPPEGSEVTVLVSDKDGDALTTALTATGGSFADPSAQSTTYTCDGANGAQTIFVTVSDGEAACDKSKSFSVTCPGIVCEYEQDFEELDPADPDALQRDGWLYFGNVFDGTGAFKFDFGPFPAPTTTGQISAIAIGEGGPDQGENQLVVFSNYDCCDPPNQGHFNGTDRVETIVFEEINPILATDIGRTFTFTFDAKRGNIAGSTTAHAFIKTIAGSDATNNVVLDTTNLPANWGTYSITLDLSDSALVGQLLQFGFSTVASNFEGAGNFYDNISFCAPGGGGGGPGIELRPLPEIYTTGKAINYGPFRAGGPGTGEIPSDADIIEDLGLLQTAGYNLLRLFGADPVHEKILQLAEANFPEMRFQQGLFLEGLAPGPPADNCDSVNNDSQVATAIQLANTYSNVVTVSVGNETSFFAAFMPLNCLEGYITETRDNVTQPVTADDDYTFYANFFGRSPNGVLKLIDFVSIHTYPFLNYQQWDWRQEAVSAGPLRAEAMMNASLVKAQDNYQAVYDYGYRDASGRSVTVGETLPIVIGETGWKWRQTTPTQEIEVYAADPVNAKWYYDLMQGWEGSAGGPSTIFIFQTFDEAWKGTDDGWGFWDESRSPNYVLCGTPAGSACNDPLYGGAGYYFP